MIQEATLDDVVYFAAVQKIKARENKSRPGKIVTSGAPPKPRVKVK